MLYRHPSNQCYLASKWSEKRQKAARRNQGRVIPMVQQRQISLCFDSAHGVNQPFLHSVQNCAQAMPYPSLYLPSPIYIPVTPSPITFSCPISLLALNWLIAVIAL